MIVSALQKQHKKEEGFLMKVRILCLAMALMLIASCAFAAPTDPILNEIGTYPLVKEPITLTVGIDQNGTVPDYDENVLTKTIEEKSGVNLEFQLFPQSEYETKLVLMVNGGETLPDIVIVGISNDSLRSTIGEAGALYATDDFYDRENGIADTFYKRVDEQGLDAKYLMDMARSSDGHIYGLIMNEKNLNTIYHYRAWINQEWLDALDLEAPTTIDELTDVLKAFRDQDPNGNGQKDEVPMTGSSVSSITPCANPLTWLQNLFIYRDPSGNNWLPLSETDGVLDVCYDKDEYREYLKYLNMLVSEKLLDESAFTQSGEEMDAQILAEVQTIGMRCGWAYSDLPAFQPFEQPAGYNGKRIVSVNKSLPSVRWGISADCEHPEVAFLLGAMGYDNETFGDYFWAYTARYGEKDVDWKYADESDVSIFDGLNLKPSLMVINEVWGGGSSNKVWSNLIFPYLGDADFAVESFNGDETYSERLQARSVTMNMQYAPDYDDVVIKLLYTSEESDTWNEIRTLIKNYVNDAACQFAMGQMDPNSDADWESYLAELETLQYKEMLEMDRAALARMTAE